MPLLALPPPESEEVLAAEDADSGAVWWRFSIIGFAVIGFTDWSLPSPPIASWAASTLTAGIPSEGRLSRSKSAHRQFACAAVNSCSRSALPLLHASR